MVIPTQVETQLQENDLIVSRTDVKGRIIYCNSAFMVYAGYNEEEILGQPHNLVRHPDMPKAIFRMMWNTLKEKKEFFGFIKNLRKDGGYYWTFANVTPDINAAGEHLGYFSVRRYPVPEAVQFFAEVYQNMVASESSVSSANKGMDDATQILMNALAGRGSYNEYICSFYR